MKKILISIYIVSLLLSLASCKQTVSNELASYTSTVTGMGGEITVEVTFNKDTIQDIQILSDNETAGVGDKALELMRNKVLTTQSISVDSVSGATISSTALLSAIKDTIKQANLEDTFQNKSDSESTTSTYSIENYDYDVVVVGSGIAGLCAGLKAQESGANVAIIEKLGIVGGTSIYSSGIFLVAEDNDDYETVVDTWLSRNKIQERNQVDETLVSNMLSVGPDLMDMIKNANVTYEMKNDVYFYPDPSEKAIQNAIQIHLASHETKQKGGELLISRLQEAFTNLGGTIYLDTPATSLIEENGEIKGVVSKTDTIEKVFNAKSVILATGDYAQNEDMTKEICNIASNNYTATAIGNTGDGITMALEVGAVLDDFQESMSGIFAPDPYDMPVVGQPYNSYPYESILVDSKGERKVSETAGTHDQMIYFVEDGIADYAWVIMDQEIANNFINLEEYLNKCANGDKVIQAYKEDSIEKLANDINIDPDVLQNTINEYNKMCINGEDSDFNKDAQYLSAIDDGTYYAVKEYNCTRGNYGGILTNQNGEVLREDGSTINGLYAAGIISSGAYFGDYYPGCEALSLGAHMGYIVGLNATKYSKSLLKN